MARSREPSPTPLFDWRPPEAPAVRYEQPETVRAASLAASFVRAMQLAEEASGKSRDEIAKSMSDYLQQPVSKAVIDQYMSEAREDYVINVVRFLAYVQATGDFRLLSLLAAPFGLAIIDEKYLAAVEEAMCAEQIEALDRRKALARRKWRGA